MKKLIGTVETNAVVRKYRDAMLAAIASGQVARQGFQDDFWTGLEGELKQQGALDKDYTRGEEFALGFHGPDHSSLYLADDEEEYALEDEDMKNVLAEAIG